MAERILRSPGVSTRELDLSAPGRIRPQGIPAGVIGTAQKGPAFVPVTFATANDFANLFGASEGKYFGAMAVNEWMRNAKSGLFIRTLGVGDGKKADSNNVTTNAGFQVGSKMRNKDSGSTETDGSADGLAINPYAGAAVDDVMTKVVTEVGRVASAGASQKTTLEFIKDGASIGGNSEAFKNDVHDYDGIYVIFESSDGTINTPTLTKRLIWLDSQGTRTKSDSSGSTLIKDGDFTVATLSQSGLDVTHANITIVDVSSASNIAVVSDLVGAAIEALAEIQAYPFGGALGDAIGNTNHYKLTVENAHSNSALKGDVTATTIATTNPTHTDATAFVTVAEGQAGATQFTGVDTVITITFDANNKPSVGSTVLVTMPDNSTTTITHATGSTITLTSLGVDADNAGIQSADAMATALNAISNVSCPATSALAIVATITNGAALPTIAVTNNSPNAPLGRTYFLGCDMQVSVNTQDYLSTATGSYQKVLRGVLMFPSGVLPGVVNNAGYSTGIASSAMPAAAYGTYGTGKDQGAETGNLSTDGLFKFVLNGFSNTANYNAHLTGSFDPLSPIYFPKVLNTDPTKIQERGHYLYAHYDVPVGLATHRVEGGNYIYMLPGAHDHNDGEFATTNDTYKPTFENWKQKFSHAFTPWILSQTLGSAPKKLFKFHMLDAGSAGHGQVKVSIANISKSTDVKSAYGSFDVQIRSANDSDLQPIILQSFSGLNLNPSSDRYIARVIGDQNTFFEFEKNEGKQKLVTEGLYPNKSQYVRIEVNDQIEAGMMEASALPIGFAGKNHLVINGGALSAGVDLIEPPVPYRQSVSIGTGATKTVDPRFYWGTQYQDIQSETERNRNTGMLSLISNLTKHFPSIGEYPAWVGDNRNAVQGEGNADLDADNYNKNYFSLEKVLIRTKLTSAGGVDTSNPVDPRFWHEALYIRDGNTSFGDANGTVYSSVVNGPANNKDKDAANGYRYLNVAKDFASSASKRYYKFTVPMQGGFDGLDIFDKDKSDMANLSAFREMSTNTSSVLGGPDGPTTASFRKAIDILAEKSDVDIQLLTIPGMRDAGITGYAIDKTEERFDALYIMDMPAYDHDSNLVTKSTQETSVTNTSSTLADRNLDSSFVATYFPDVVLQDGEINVVAPSSVAVLGAMSLNDSVAHPWYAPAGFARGALPTAIEPAVYLNRPNMDVLYDTDINPITTFPNSGNSVVIFGQKTMLQAQSALDRVNVRRLLIDVRRKVRNVANTILFEPNRESTLARFSALVNPILGRIQQQQGLDRYKVVIDTTTTTQQDVENNTIRGKIFLQPTRSIEFISLDFVVTNAGAEI